MHLQEETAWSVMHVFCQYVVFAIICVPNAKYALYNKLNDLSDVEERDFFQLLTLKAAEHFGHNFHCERDNNTCSASCSSKCVWDDQLIVLKPGFW